MCISATPVKRQVTNPPGHKPDPPAVCGGAPLVLIGLLLLVGCRPSEPKPVEITATDMCASCKMAISEKRWAAELLDRDGEPVKFDDIGCMLRYRKRMQDSGAIVAFFVVDFESRRWLQAATAHYVRSPEFRTPMGSGIVAYNEASSAAAAAAEHHGELLRFTDLLRD